MAIGPIQNSLEPVFKIPCTEIAISIKVVSSVALAILGAMAIGISGLIGGAVIGYAIVAMIQSCKPDPKPPAENSILSFLDGHPDLKGRTIDSILNGSDEELERDHDWVQQVFPTTNRSQFHPDAARWVVTPDVAQAIKSSPARQEKLKQAYIRVLRFFQLDDAFIARPRWVTPGNHNFLRVTRILNSLKLAGLQREAQDFMGRLAHLRGLVGERTFGFWEAAAG